MLAVFVVLILFVRGAAVAGDTNKKHDNTTPINNQAAKGVTDNNAAVANGDLSEAQGRELNNKDRKIERDEQKNADQRHGLVAKSDHAKFNRKAKHVNKERAKIIQKNTDEKTDQKKEEQK